MSRFDLKYAQEHLPELFDDARLGEEVIIVRADGRSCELTPLAEIPADGLPMGSVEIPKDDLDPTSDPIPA